MRHAKLRVHQRERFLREREGCRPGRRMRPRRQQEETTTQPTAATRREKTIDGLEGSQNTPPHRSRLRGLRPVRDEQTRLRLQTRTLHPPGSQEAPIPRRRRIERLLGPPALRILQAAAILRRRGAARAPEQGALQVSHLREAGEAQPVLQGLQSPRTAFRPGALSVSRAAVPGRAVHGLRERDRPARPRGQLPRHEPEGWRHEDKAGIPRAEGGRVGPGLLEPERAHRRRFRVRSERRGVRPGGAAGAAGAEAGERTRDIPSDTRGADRGDEGACGEDEGEGTRRRGRRIRRIFRRSCGRSFSGPRRRRCIGIHRRHVGWMDGGRSAECRRRSTEKDRGGQGHPGRVPIVGSWPSHFFRRLEEDCGNE
mmetsp:Transcript_1460/g.3108  ORF Transcript_1460/g.3108 Transcript_1460/m.3108 type:complete len:369 (-) Transcript_1460:1098-2204(-)